MCQAVAAYVLGPGIEAFSSGPDGGREASFRGRVPYPSSADPWNGLGIVQAKFKERILGTSTDTVLAALNGHIVYRTHPALALLRRAQAGMSCSPRRWSCPTAGPGRPRRRAAWCPN